MIQRDWFRWPSVPDYTRSHFRDHFIQSDRVLLVLFAIQWVVATLVTSLAYDTYLYGFVSGGIITLSLWGLYRRFAGTQMMRALMGVGMMLFSLVFIQQHLGRIEMHFHIFIALAILSLYKDVVPLLSAAATTILHHIVFNYLQLYEVSLFGMPVMVFNYGCGIDIVLLHAVFVVAETLVVGYIIRTQIEYAMNLNRSEKEISGLNLELTHTSLHDPLTGLPNRSNLYAQLLQITATAHRNRRKFAVLFLDLDHFKYINDTLGHNVGDDLLKKVSLTLQSMIRENDVIARIGGDEFIIVLNDVEGVEALETIGTNIIHMFRHEWIVKNHHLRLSASLGAAIYPEDSEDVDELMQFADIAMYQAKGEGRDQFRIFTHELSSQVHREMEIANDMHRALEAGEFSLYLQPKVEIRSKAIIGAEALIRWNHPQKGMINPGDFIHIAENTGFILTLGIVDHRRIDADYPADGRGGLRYPPPLVQRIDPPVPKHPSRLRNPRRPEPLRGPPLSVCDRNHRERDDGVRGNVAPDPPRDQTTGGPYLYG
jgi:diguanylate cyclase